MAAAPPTARRWVPPAALAVGAVGVLVAVAPWYRSAAPADPFRVVVASGDPVVKRGDSVTLTAFAEAAGGAVPVPDAAAVVVRGPRGGEARLAMAADGKGAFHVTRPGVAAGFEYRVEVGPVASGWHRVTVVEPVELAPETAVELTPPEYARRSVRPRTTPWAADLEALAHSTATLRLRFTRPAASAHLEWKPAGGGVSLVPLTLNADHTAATAAVALTQSGTLRLVAFAELGGQKVRTDAAAAVRVVPDAPPRFERVAGVGTQPRAARPWEPVAVAVAAVDDIGLGRAEVEFDAGPDGRTPPPLAVPLHGVGTRRATGRAVIDLAGRGGEGDVVRFRLRVWDDRDAHAPRLAPQDAVYPPAGWAELRLSAYAPPAAAQEVTAQRDAVKVAVEGAVGKVRRAAGEVIRVRDEAAGRPVLALDQTVRLTTARDRVRAAVAGLTDAAADPGLPPELQSVAAVLKAVAGGPLKDADDALRTAGKVGAVAARDAALTAAAQKLDAAALRLEELLAHNDRAARGRLDRKALEALAADQGALAASADPPEELARRQRQLLDRLAALLADSDPLRAGVAELAARRVREATDDARDLADAQRELADAVRQTAADARRAVLDPLVRDQEAVAAAAADLLFRAYTAARLVGGSPDGAEFKRAAGLLANDRLLDALAEQERLASALDQLADGCERWADTARDPKEAARQLARWQDDLRGRVSAATRARPLDQLPTNIRDAFRSEQRSIAAAAGRLRFPTAPSVTAARARALKALDAGADAPADQSMQAAADALAALADLSPSAAERLSKARPELDRLIAEQESVGVAVEQALRGGDGRSPDPDFRAALARKLAAVAERQQKLVSAVDVLDLPTLEARRGRARAALLAAAADLKAGAPFDAAASQQAARRELDRLRQAADRVTPPDDRAADLARRQAAVADAIAGLGTAPTPKQLEPVAELQREVARQAAALAGPESPPLLHAAREAVKAAEAAFKEPARPADVAAATRAAADALRTLADRLAGAEADADRVRRLAAARRQAAADGRKLVGRPFNPDASAEAGRQLAREADDLAATRVGPAAQPAKRRAHDLYARLRAATEPDRQVKPQADLAAALDALAAEAAGAAELAAGRRPDTPPDAADDGYRPTAALAAEVRALAKRQREAREAAGRADRVYADRLRPTPDDTLAALAARQRELAATAADLGDADAARAAANRLKVGAVRAAVDAAEAATRQFRDTGSSSADALADRQDAILNDFRPLLENPGPAVARQHARQAELAKSAADLAATLERLGTADAAADALAASEAMGEAVRKGEPAREEARRSLAAVIEKLAAAAPPPAPPPVPLPAAEAVRDATAAMRAAAAKPDPVAMRTAADALKRAANAVFSPDP